MSLKAFHVVFISAATLLLTGFGAWAVRAYLHAAGAGYLAMGIAALAAAVALVVYGVWFLKKMKDVSYL